MAFVAALQLAPWACLLAAVTAAVLWVFPVATVQVRLQRVAAAVLAFALLWVLGRTLLTHRWLPGSLVEVLWFAAAELFLIPVGLVLLLMAWVYRPRRRTRDGSAAAAGLICAAVLGCSIAVAYVTFPMASRRLHWARWGFDPPMRLARIGQVQDVTGIQFPASAVLVDGVFRGGPQPFLIAQLRLGREQVESFLRGQPFRWAEVTAGGEANHFGPNESRLMADRGWAPNRAHQTLWADGGTNGGICQVLISLDAPREAVVYVLWEA